MKFCCNSIPDTHPPTPAMGPRKGTGWYVQKGWVLIPPDLGYNGVRSASGWYTSCWNAFLLMFSL